MIIYTLIYSLGKRDLANKQLNTTQTNAVSAAPVSTTSTTTRRPFLEGLRSPCSCAQGQCGCCTGMILETFRQKACVNVTYEPDDFAFTARITLNNRVMYKNTISGGFTGFAPYPFIYLQNILLRH